MNDSRLQCVLENVRDAQIPNLNDLEYLLSLNDEAKMAQLFDFASEVRRDYIGDGILMRGIIEFSSYCDNECLYCGLNKNNTTLKRFRLTKPEIMSALEVLIASKMKTLVLQSGEEKALDVHWLAGVVKEVKSKYDIAITLSCGEFPKDVYKLWRDAGADRYLLKIETSDKSLYEKFHPNMSYENRIRCLWDLKELGYQVGSGTLVGLKGQTAAHLAKDVLFYNDFKFDMLGIGLFIPHKQTKLASDNRGELDMTLKMLAVTRIVTKKTHLPATTATGSLGNGDNRIDALKAGANVIMPNYTPEPYRKAYEIYPGKRCVDEKPGLCNKCIEMMAKGLGRFVDYGRGDSLF